MIDHINRQKFDNRRSNIRLANKQGNSANTGLKKNNRTGLKGVDALQNGRYQARIGFNNRKIGLGTFETVGEAALAYDNAARFYFGEFACTNAMIQEKSG